MYQRVATTGWQLREQRMRLQKVILLLFALMLLSCSGVWAQPRSNNRPNIIFVLLDDLGYGDLSCTGNKNVQAVNMDRLAAEGTRFTKFYVSSPICSPSRAAFLTGQYPARYRMHSSLNNRAENKQIGRAHV